MKSIKELGKTKDNTFERGYEIALKDVLKLIDESNQREVCKTCGGITKQIFSFL